MAELGLFGMRVPERYGGAGMAMMDYVVALEEVAAADASVGLTMASHNSLGSGHIFQAGKRSTEKQVSAAPGSRRDPRGLGPHRAGVRIRCGCRPYPRHPSRAQGGRPHRGGMGDRRLQDLHHAGIGGRDLRRPCVDLSGEKTARAHGVSSSSPGRRDFGSGRKIEKMGLHASDTTELILEGVVVPDEHRLGEVDNGFYDTLQILDKGRVSIGAWAVGIGRAAFDAARTYARDRVQFGQPISEFQGVQHMLADMATELDAARLLVWNAASMQDNGLRITRQASEAKYYAARAATRACNAALQIHGGYGYTREFPIERYYRDVKLAEIGEGTNEVQKMVIGRELIKEFSV